MSDRMNTTEANVHRAIDAQASDLAAENLRLRYQVADLAAEMANQAANICDMFATIDSLTAANAALAADNARLGKRVEALRAIADLTELRAHEFARKYPELNKQLDCTDMEKWGEVLSEFASRAWLAGGDA